MREGESPSESCGRVMGTVWRDECWFRAAEIFAERDALDTAAALCLNIERFRDACAQHLWDPALAAVWLDATPEQALSRAEELFAEWDPRVGAATDLTDRFWRHWYRYGYARGLPRPQDVDSACSGAPPGRQRACRKATRRMLSETNSPRVGPR